MKMKYMPDERHKRILELISPVSTDRILVVGTGNFPRIEILLFNLYGCEKIVSGDLKPAHTVAARAALPKLEFIYLDAQKSFPLADHSFDKVIFTEVLEHLPDEDLPLQEIRRVLKPSGHLILSVPKRRWFRVLNPVWWLEHVREYDEATLSQVLDRNGFLIEKRFVGGGVFDVIELWVFLFCKYLLGKAHHAPFFPVISGKAYQPDFNGKGADIIVWAGLKP